jgi:hypothetical protein
MLGKRDPQRSFFGAAAQLGSQVVAKLGFYGKLASEGHRLFREEDFADAYCANNGRPSTPPGLLAMARLLQHYEGISDAEVIERCRFDLRWKLALDLDATSIDAPFVKSTFQAFRARLTLHIKEGLAFEKSVRAAREAGLLPKQLRVALDSSPIRGRGAVKDTFNLLSDAIVAVIRAAAAKVDRPAAEVARESGLARHLDSPSIKGTEAVNWDDHTAVRGFLQGLLEDSERAVALAEKVGAANEEVALLRKVIAQDIEADPANGTPRIRDEVTPGRVVSVHDPEMRHGHKSNGKVYSGHKAHVAVETTRGVITAVDLTAPSEADGAQVGTLVEETRQLTGSQVGEALGDTAYSTRMAIEQAGQAQVELTTKMASPPKGKYGPRDFKVSDDGQTATCPAGLPSARQTRRSDGTVHFWSPAQCAPCPLKDACTKAPKRSLHIPPDFHDRRRRERHARSPEGLASLRQRVVAEHAIGRLKNLGAAAARYFGRTKTKAQLLWTAAVANLSLTWSAAALHQP